ncbi:MAG: DUF393 domain-containing protein [Bdellovibrionales bacterium]|nr:DUF393 domain-containing protein [Bdellovibrionales bacterium]
MKDQKNLQKHLQKKLTVYFDGLCKVCSTEINHYKKQRGAENIVFVDICAPHFDAHKEGVDPVLVHKIMHVRRSDGSLATRVDAFIEIWKQLPRYRVLAKVANITPVRWGLEVGYSCFAVARPFLPRYSAAEDCSDSPYCATHTQ